ncbi:LCP family protein [Allostreptomyces psammosilenae]|uniref:LCP family protein required for cell wall assembly n=1 Tax=Allostreptomyces psammosilenae TaxID=1892865 RepID=A0A853A230_9ACTN|nr:LCP family protein [Allostreptomyces psammosilenae]NYI08187.1 LCP family protein required for cell wall assembly [Allostreptomyces psammosilenae]
MQQDQRRTGGRTQPRPGAARRSRGRRILQWTGGSLATVVLLVAGAAVWAYNQLSGNITSTDVERALGEDRPVDLHPGALDIALIGSDSRAGTNGQYGDFDTMQSDTLMLLHIAANREWATVLSFPRDSWVDLPACDMGDGTMSEPHQGKINEAYTLGGLSGDPGNAAVCSMKVLEATTGLRIEHFVTIDFQGFKGMVNALGGVEVCPEEAVHSEKADLHLEAGCQIIRDEDALAWVRARYNIGDSSDLGRIERQQEFLTSMAERARSQLANPTALYGFLDATTRSLTTDSELASVADLASLATTMMSIPEDAIDFRTVPNFPRSLVVPSDQANVLWQQPEADQIFEALRNDTRPPSDERLGETPADPGTGGGTGAEDADPGDAGGIPPSHVPVRVLNGTGTGGLAAEVAEQLRQAGYQVIEVGNAGQRVEFTSIAYPNGMAKQAETLAGDVPGVEPFVSTATSAAVVLTIGADWPGLDP